MFITWCTCTYGRPHLLSRVIHCFEQQDYKDARMVVVDDGGQYGNQHGEKWELFSTPTRYKSLGVKRNASVRLAQEMFPDTEAFMPVDDDDIALPWHTTATAEALSLADWSRPSVILSAKVIIDLWLFFANYTGNPDDQTVNRMYHPSWGMKLDAFWDSGGYPEDMSGPEDKFLMKAMEKNGATQADPIALGNAPSFVYCWGETSISGLLNSGDPTGKRAWESLKQTLPPATLEKWTPPFDLNSPVVAPGIRRRPF